MPYEKKLLSITLISFLIENLLKAAIAFDFEICLEVEFNICELWKILLRELDFFYFFTLYNILLQ